MYTEGKLKNANSLEDYCISFENMQIKSSQLSIDILVKIGTLDVDMGRNKGSIHKNFYFVIFEANPCPVEPIYTLPVQTV